MHRAIINAAFLIAIGANVGANPCPAYRAGQSDHWANGRTFYQVFVRSFADSDGDGIGDFRGLQSRLDYLNDGDPDTDSDLGISGIWLMPITESPSYHGYDTVDYDAIEQDYGTEEDFDHFIDAAHTRGIKVIMDMVVNHCSAEHPWFIEANRSRRNPKHDWFIWRKRDPGWTQPWSPSATWHKSRTLNRYYYGLFWGGMPDLNFENPDVRKEMIAISHRWLERGVDGFRLDASRHIVEAGVEDKADGSPETHEWWREYTRGVKAAYPDALLLGENWTSIAEIAPYYGDVDNDQLDMNFNFELAGALISSVRTESPAPVEEALCDVSRFYPAHALDGIFLTNHDMVRVITQLDGDRQRARLASALMMTLPGVPFIYYGEEIGLPNGPGDEDPEKRTPMRWTEEGGFTSGKPWKTNRRVDPATHVDAQQADPDSLLKHYKGLIRLRNRTPALARGGFAVAPVVEDVADSIFAFERQSDGERVLVVANFGKETVAQAAIELGDATAGAELLWGDSALASAGNAQVRVGPVGPQRIAVFELKTPCPQR